MSDPELEAIRRARMAELRGSAGGGPTAGGGVPGGLPAGLGASGGADGEREEKLAQQEEMKRQMLSQILDSDARERLSRIALVKPQKSNAVSDILLQMARSGQVRQRVTEDQLIALLDQIDQANPAQETGKITVARKKKMDSDDEDWDI
ncbi:uncharacterized protein MJAP1_003773 [Malassezia japonica]|uniref:Programmed cell death protein 5 n=1 Tax=Malassezia japonica TaxID=223818 RepID=A0AAF0JC58_9BASI|nr:uncharacterized protein MJAP1_003773 [Malassezia japonica]WFD40784.1 hypothetical protein MJAP1_003773 [Malassezia japonica]